MTKPSVLGPTTIATISDASSHQTPTPEYTPSSTPSTERQSASLGGRTKMDEAKVGESSAKEEIKAGEPEVKSESTKTEGLKDQKTQASVEPKSKACKKHAKANKQSKSRKSKKDVESGSDSSSPSSSSESEDELEDSENSDSSSSEDEATIKKRRKKAKRKAKAKKEKKRVKKVVSSSEESESLDSSSSEEEVRQKRKSKKSKKHKRNDDSDDEEDDDGTAETEAQLRALELQKARRARKAGRAAAEKKKKKKAKQARKSSFSSSKPQYFRADELWDREIHAYKLSATAEAADDDEYGEYSFHVRRRFDWEGKYSDTVVDIKSKALRGALQKVMGSCKAVSLAEDVPQIDPNMLFLYLEDIREYRKELKGKSESEKKKKARKVAAEQASHLKCLLKYIDKDYAATKKTLYPLLEAGNITFDLVWTLFRCDTIMYTSTYSAPDEPRAFKVEYATKESSFMKGTWYDIEGRYLDFDGKSFGLGTMEVEIESFKGPRRINSLPCYPLKYHKDAEEMKQKLIERGRKFTELSGMQYKFHKGLGFMKRKRQVVKVTINGRVMVDPSTFRRINPNYPISTVKPADPDFIDEEPDSDDGDCCCNCDDDDAPRVREPLEDADQTQTRMKVVVNKEGDPHIVEVEVDENGNEVQKENIDKLSDDNGIDRREFSEEELLIASPVVLGFAFSEKMWLEFTVSGIHEIDWNEGAFDSLVLPEKQKSIVKALVQSHTSEAQEKKNIDDVIQGKGKGLVAVLHGTPGVGKTLTAEGIAELLRCPLYCVSAGELGTNPRELEQELTKILDVAHSWGAVLLLDEADVFLEARTAQDIHRNALVSIFLRLLEYFQGILFLTTNRVSTFDDAFQSRIHIALRYQELDFKARRSIFKIFLSAVAALPNVTTETFSDADLDRLARRANLNGRQIKNAVRSAQALAVNEKVPLGMTHVMQVLDVAEAFERDLKGGSGYMDAMRSYT